MASQSTGNLLKLKLYICTLELRSSKVFVSDVLCMSLFQSVLYLRSEYNLKRFDFLREWRFKLVQKFQLTRTDSFVEVFIDNFVY